MKKNKKRSKRMSVVAQYTAHAAAIMMAAFVAVIINLLAGSSCSQLMKSIGEKERILGRLEDERMRESARWEEMKIPEKLEIALNKRGLSMNYAKDSQRIRMSSDGKVMPGQVAVARANQRASATGAVAMNRTSSANKRSSNKKRR
ncbi:MAG: hypothetical protein IJQ34_09830 [Kiritimatiellae bacterium]|nr:hypothetical protein [Kiritimatiellia bacterium]